MLIPCSQTIAKILASTEYIHTLPPDLQQKAAASWMGALHIVFSCQIIVRRPLSPSLPRALPMVFLGELTFWLAKLACATTNWLFLAWAWI